MLRDGLAVITLSISLGVFCASAATALGGKDQSRLPAEELEPSESAPKKDAPEGDEGYFAEDLQPGDIPEVRRVELTEISARQAIDAFMVIRDKYTDKGIEKYETLEEFAQKSPHGKEFTKEVNSFGFRSVGLWNDTIMNVGFAYSAIVEDSVPEIKLQIEDVMSDTTLSKDARDKMVTSLKTLIPSDNNRNIIEKLNKDPNYADKLRLLTEQE